jgi:hypothetical protein
MRTMVLALGLLSLAPLSANADPYKWCAVYGGFGNTRESCYYVTLGQCQATVSGLGGWCRPSPYYDGKPVRTPEDYAAEPRRKRSKKK